MTPHSDLPFTTLNECRGSELIQAIEHLASAHTRGVMKIHISNRPPLEHAVVEYEPRPEVVRITGYGMDMPATALSMQVENGLNPWPVTVAWPDGEMKVLLCPSTRTIRFQDSIDTGELNVANCETGPWRRIEGRGTVPDLIVRAVRAISDELVVGPDQCIGTAANCTRYANKVLAAGFLCAISLGGDTASCQESHDAHCDWCKCKGYNCPACN